MKYFVISDVHSFYTPMVRDLTRSGFELDNPEHILIVCGDVFDRGLETIEVYNFLRNIPKKRCILIRGNHEELYFKLLKKKYPEEFDFSNGTVKTFLQIAKEDPSIEYDLRVGHFIHYGSYYEFEEIDSVCQDIWNRVKQKVNESEITKWLKSKQWINYYELDKFIFVHSFIPLNFSGDRGLNEDYCIYYGWTQYFTFNPDWRSSPKSEWAKAAWGKPMTFFDAGLFDKEKENGKILVCGHYRCSEFNTHYLGIMGNDIYCGPNLIAIDPTVVLSDQVNVLVIDNGICYDQYGNKIKE